MKKQFLILVVLVLLMGACAPAAPYASFNGIEVYDPYAYIVPAGETTAAYMIIKNTGAETDRLVSATCEAANMVTVMESMMMEGDVMSMSDIPGIEIPSNASVELKPGGYHIMLMDMKQDMVDGGTVTVVLEFEKAGSMALEVPVKVP